MSTPKTNPSLTLLASAHSPTTANELYTTRIQHKPLSLLPTTTASNNPPDARSLRRSLRAAKNPRPRRKPRPLSAREKRKYRTHELDRAAERRYETYRGLHRLWCGYMRDVLGVSGDKVEGSGGEGGGAEGGGTRKKYVTPQQAGPLLASADFHGAEVQVVRSRCVGRVGVKGFVVRDTKFTFVVVTRRDRVVTLPKEGCWFAIEVPLGSQDEEGMAGNGEEVAEEGVRKREKLVFELQGDQFANRAPDRATKRFKMRLPKDF